MGVQLAGRTDVADYFKSSGIRAYKVLSQTPLLVFHDELDGVRVEVVRRPVALLDLPDDTPVMGQWQGKHSSDFFQFTVGQFRAYVDANPRSADQVI